MVFCTAINCMDGRVQLPVINYLKRRFEADYADMITEAGPIRILAEQKDGEKIISIMNRLEISVSNHSSKAIAIVGHFDCAGNPVSKEKQIEQIKQSVQFIKDQLSDVEVIGLWVEETLQISEVA